jgi:hypothetical protein
MKRPLKKLANLCENDWTVPWSKLIGKKLLLSGVRTKERMKGEEDPDWLRGEDLNL